MTALPTKKYISPKEYLTTEREALEKHEYRNGEVFQMAGAKMAHIRICGNLIRGLGNQLTSRDCQAFQSDFRTYIPTTGLYTYPDITVVCGKVELVPDGYLDTLLHPTLIIEVPSPSTADYDRGAKFDHYTTVDSL